MYLLICNTFDNAYAPCDRIPFLPLPPNPDPNPYPRSFPSFPAIVKSNVRIYYKAPLQCFNNTSLNANMSASKKLPETRNVGSWNRNVVNTPGLMRVEMP